MAIVRSLRQVPVLDGGSNETTRFETKEHNVLYFTFVLIKLLDNA